MPAKKISLEHAKSKKLFYFVANVVIYRTKDKRCLILKRDEREKVHPGKWAMVGGKLEWKDLPVEHPTRVNDDVLDYENAVEDLLKREALEEANVKIKGGLKYINSVAFIRPDGIPVILVKFAALYAGGKIIPEKGGFTDFTWVNEKEVQKYDCIKGIDAEIKQAVQQFKK